MRTVLRLLDASGLVPIGLIAASYGYERIGWALVGAGITCAVICVGRILNEAVEARQ